jgi:hypothetical protein
MKIKQSVDSRIEPHPIRLADYNVSNLLASDIVNYGLEV